MDRMMEPFIIEIPKYGWRLRLARLFHRPLTRPYLYTPRPCDHDHANDGASVIMDIAGIWVCDGPLGARRPSTDVSVTSPVD